MKNIISRLPKNTQINGAMQQIVVHMRASALIAGSACFQSGIGDTSAVSQLPFPVDTGVLKDQVIHKRKATATATTAAQQPGTSSQPATGPTPAKVVKVSPIGSDCTDIELMPNQCHCRQAFNNQADLKRHVKVVHRNDYWGCLGEWVWDDGTESHCPKVCKDKFALWKHFRTQHQDYYLHYCPVDSYNWGTDEASMLLQHIKKVHKRKPVADVVVHQLICPKCKQQFGQQHKLRNHVLICGTQD